MATSIASSGLIVGLLTLWLERRRLRHDVTMDIQRFLHQRAMEEWDRIQLSYEREIKMLAEVGDTQAANERRREYVEYQAAWRANRSHPPLGWSEGGNKRP